MRPLPVPEQEKNPELGIALQYQLHIEGAYVVTKIEHPEVYDESNDEYYQTETEDVENDDEEDEYDEDEGVRKCQEWNTQVRHAWEEENDTVLTNEPNLQQNVTTYRVFKDIVTIGTVTGHICHQTGKYVIIIPCQSWNEYMEKYHTATNRTLKKYGTYILSSS